MQAEHYLIVYMGKGSGNCKSVDNARVRLFPSFTRHHLITILIKRIPCLLNARGVQLAIKTVCESIEETHDNLQTS